MMNSVQKARLTAIGISDEHCTARAVVGGLGLSQIAADVVRMRADDSGIPVEIALAQIIEEWACSRLVESHAIATALANKKPSRPEKRLYFIQKGQDGPIKIGVSSSLGKRVKQLSTGSDDSLRVLAFVDQTSEINEAVLHKRFSEHRLFGEWFKPHEAIVEFVGSLQS